jgi:2-polyprenyl-6-methoxyphenol hydroxylase-like FAD-dependent oxidoreductase
MADYDIITIGGGLGGSSLAKAMAEQGARVLVVERETQFKDRVRGEGMTPWGCVDAQKLGIYDLLVSSCGHEVPWWDNFIGPMQIAHRNVVETTPGGMPTLTFYHPEMQETLLAAAETAGAEVRRGVRAKAVTPGKTPSVTVERNGGTEALTTRLVVGVDGRGSVARKWAGFEEKQEKEHLLIGGVLFHNVNLPEDTVRLNMDLQRGHAGIIFPQGGKRARAYYVANASEGMRLQGEKDIPRFIEDVVTTGIPREYFEGAQPVGPLATFDAAASWIEHPYKDGVVLIGDAAASSDPSWGQGLSLTMRDARVLRDALVANDDWDAAGHAYATEHDRYFAIEHTTENWLSEFFYETGSGADQRRERAFPLIAQDPARIPDHGFSGPDLPVDETTRRRLFGEE